MLVLPIPLVVSLVLGFLLVRTWERLPPRFTALLVLCAAQGLLISLVQHYGLEVLRPMQPVVAAAIPPLAFVAFQTAVVRGPLRRDWVHVVVPLATAGCVVALPEALDALVPGIFVLYGGAILMGLRRPALPLARLEAGPRPERIWRALAIALLLSALSDVLIAVALVAGRPDLPPLIVSVFSSLALLAIGLLSLSPDGMGTPEPAPPPRTPADEADADLVHRLDTLLADEEIYLEPDLTLARLARRLVVPAKQLSAAVNRVTGDNISRHINGFRIRHACTLLEEGERVTEAVFASGFNTKSNFNREFGRITGMSPSAWVAQNKAGA